MAEPEERYQVYEPQTDDPKEAIKDLVRQINDELQRIAQKIADKADA